MRRNGKYNARKTVGLWHGQEVIFDSKREAQRAAELQLLEKAGKINELLRQVPYLLIPKSPVSRAIVYIADFVYWDALVTAPPIVEDVKGMKTAVYKIKRALMWDKHRIEIKELT